MRSTPAATELEDDTGLGLIEFIVALLVSTIVLVAVGTILINSWLTQEDVTTKTQATNRGQLITSAIERAMRNGITFEVSGPNGSELRVWTSLPGALECQGFRITDGLAQMTTTAGPLPVDATTWADWDSDVAQRASGATPINFFVPSGRTVTYSFDVRTESAPVRFGGEASLRYAASGGGNPCWV